MSPENSLITFGLRDFLVSRPSPNPSTSPILFPVFKDSKLFDFVRKRGLGLRDEGRGREGRKGDGKEKEFGSSTGRHRGRSSIKISHVISYNVSLFQCFTKRHRVSRQFQLKGLGLGDRTGRRFEINTSFPPKAPRLFYWSLENPDRSYITWFIY